MADQGGDKLVLLNEVSEVISVAVKLQQHFLAQHYAPEMLDWNTRLVDAYQQVRVRLAADESGHSIEAVGLIEPLRQAILSLEHALGSRDDDLIDDRAVGFFNRSRALLSALPGDPTTLPPPPPIRRPSVL